MKFTPKTEQQIKEERSLPEGWYPCKVTSAVDTYSKAGNEMIELELIAWNEDGKEYKLRDWLMEQGLGKMLAFCDATGLRQSYQDGILDGTDCDGKECFARVIIDTKGNFAGTNKVASYASEIPAPKGGLVTPPITPAQPDGIPGLDNKTEYPF